MFMEIAKDTMAFALRVGRREGLRALGTRAAAHCRDFARCRRFLNNAKALPRTASTADTVDFVLAGSGVRSMQIRSEILQLAELIRLQKPRTVLEIGTAAGGTLFLLSRMAAPDAHLVSVDLPGGACGGGYPSWRGDIYRRFAAPEQRMSLFRADSHSTETLERVKQLLDGSAVDVLFIDGDHTYEGVKRDFELYSPLVRDGGLIGLHDIVKYDPSWGYQVEVNRFWTEVEHAVPQSGNCGGPEPGQDGDWGHLEVTEAADYSYRAMPGDATFERLEAVVEPYNQTHDRYQAYYRTGLSAYCSSHGIAFQETGSRFPNLLRLLGKIRASKKLNRCPGGPALMETFARFMGAHAGRDHALGTYILHGHGETVKIVIDAFDSGELQSDELLNWCDIYFKTNYWPTRVYPPKTLPMTNLNPDVLPHLEYLREARKAEKEWDLFAFFRIWGGVDEVEGVEHNLALLETLARVKCKKFLLASLVTGDTGAAVREAEKRRHPVYDYLDASVGGLAARGALPFKHRASWHAPMHSVENDGDIGDGGMSGAGLRIHNALARPARGGRALPQLRGAVPPGASGRVRP